MDETEDLLQGGTALRRIMQKGFEERVKKLRNGFRRENTRK